MPRYVATWLHPGSPAAPAVIEADSTIEACQMAEAFEEGWAVSAVGDDFVPPNAPQSAAIGRVALRALIRQPAARLSLARNRDNAWVASVHRFDRPAEPPTRYEIALDGTVRETSNFD